MVNSREELGKQLLGTQHFFNKCFRDIVDESDENFSYIIEPNPSDKTIVLVESSSNFWTESTENPLLLIKGLIAGGVLGFVFSQKRWRVNYGLDPSRKPPIRLALPFRAKDSPTPRSEFTVVFSHPDVVIVLTCLSYYYGGLNDLELELAFGSLLKSDEADIEYREWVEDAPSLPHAFHQLAGININDRSQCANDVFPHLRKAKRAVDYFLSHIVFPKEMKQFPQKLSASGWDIGKVKTNPTTGFSGTNDSKLLLPLDVHHLDLKEKRHTNALVLEHLLRSENTIQLMQRSSLAKAWLTKLTSGTKEAAVFFNDNDELCAVDRRGIVETLQTSPYVKQLDRCVIFLDEAHTRGTDLQLPRYYCAAVTLEPNLTKDRLVQACMRIRELGRGQSVVFCVPEEIQMKILQDTERVNTSIQVIDILAWAIHETSLDLHRSIPLWAYQGVRFEQQQRTWDQCTNVTGIEMTQTQAEQFLEDESRTIRKRYYPTPSSAHPSIPVKPNNNPTLAAISTRCATFAHLEFSSTALQEEQERELSPEIEEERQTERPPPAGPLAHSIHPDVKRFVQTDVFRAKSPAFISAFHSLRDLSLAKSFDVRQFPADLLATLDFVHTVRLSSETLCVDRFLRPAQWILTSSAGSSTATAPAVQHMLIISPYEAQELLPQIRSGEKVTLHLYAPRPTLAYRPLDGLRLCPLPPPPRAWSVPDSLVQQLNLFAGQLYFFSFEE
ncbi:hypothetical protein K461DRAFT_329009 [Myriangium duriaei CBS 260.36]|uniref:ubiquitinyl hydrolase 1 n=1 Tax=Myriangium duriaei CBS 260.36 TaxID=1168546 RepID=A0A9P4MH71_9PEZI|nr:hypothetical protein K461DRAFT_329009 [Myriangium duriaei CBS 260.36]